MTTSPTAQATRILLDARAAGTPLAELPTGLDPATREDAYRIQDAMLAEIGPVGAWKIMAGAEGDPIVAPLPARYMAGSGATFAQSLPVALIEVEIALTLGADLPQRGDRYGAEDVRDAIASFHPALELISFTWKDREKVPYVTQIADLQNHAGLIVGPPLATWESIEAGTTSASLLLDGDVVATKPGGASTMQILEALAWLANHAAARNLPLKAGQVITTGSRVLHLVNGQRRVEGQVSGLGTVTVELA